MSINITYMRKGVPFFIVLILVLFASHGYGDEIFAPFVSGLSAEARDNRIIISWRPAPAEIDSYVIFRSSFPIDSDSFHKAVEAGVVQGSMTSYIDTPPDTSDYYYGVLGRSPGGTLYKLFIPYRNVLLDAVAVETGLSPEQNATSITGISAVPTDESIEIRYESSNPDRRVIVFRSNRPIRSENDILDSSAVATTQSSEQVFVDTPLGGIPYYYAILDAEIAKSGAYPLNIGENVLSNPVSLPISRSGIDHDKPKISLTPLPYLLLSSTILSGEEIGRGFNFTSLPSPLSEETLDTWKRIEEKVLQPVPSEKVNPRILQTETADKLRGEEQMLASIVAIPFSSREIESVNWNRVEHDLIKFMNVRRSANVKDRAEFYLGQSYYFQGEYDKALVTFLTAQDSLYSEVQPWIERIYPHLRRQI